MCSESGYGRVCLSVMDVCVYWPEGPETKTHKIKVTRLDPNAARGFGTRSVHWKRQLRDGRCAVLQGPRVLEAVVAVFSTSSQAVCP